MLPLLNGRRALGTWQSVVLVDTNADNPNRRVRKVRLSFLPGLSWAWGCEVAVPMPEHLTSRDMR
jgi:hypothetical protein